MKLSRTVQATQEHIDFLIGKLRDTDDKECWAAIRKTADQNLQLGFDRSSLCWAILKGEEPIGCFGVAPTSLLSNKGVPWLLATPELEKISYNFLRQSKEHVHRMLHMFDRLENWVDVDNEIATKWLRWCGFNMEDPKVYGFGKKMFRRFWLDREGLCADQQ